LTGHPGQAGRLDGRLCGVLAPEPATGHRHDDPDAGLGDAECLGQQGTHPERLLRAGPDDEALLLPVGHHDPRFERHVGDVSRRVGLGQSVRRGIHGGVHITLLVVMRAR